MARFLFSFLVIFCLWSAQAQKKTLVLSGWATSPQERDDLQKKAEIYNSLQKKVSVSYEPVMMTDYYNQNLVGKIKSGNSPDVFYLRDADIRFYLGLEAVKPIQTFLKKAGLGQETLYKPCADAFVINGQVYAIPKDFNIIGLTVNEKLRRLAGLPDNGPESIADLETWLEKMNGVGGDPKRKGLVASGHDFEILPFISQAAGAGWNIAAPGERELLPGLRLYSSLTSKNLLLLDFNVQTSIQTFTSGKTGSVIQGIWFFPLFRDQFPGLEFKIYPLPSAVSGKKPVTVLTTVGWAVASSCKNPQEAVDFIAWLVSSFNYQDWLKNGVAFPPGNEAIRQIKKGRESRFGARELLASVDQTSGLIRIPPEAVDVVCREYKSMLVSSKKPEDIVKTVLARLAEKKGQK